MQKYSVVDWPWLDARCKPKPLYHCCPQLGRGRKIQKKARGLREGQEEISKQSPSQAK